MFADLVWNNSPCNEKNYAGSSVDCCSDYKYGQLVFADLVWNNSLCYKKNYARSSADCCSDYKYIKRGYG